jgi:hypothetical protein
MAARGGRAALRAASALLVMPALGAAPPSAASDASAALEIVARPDAFEVVSGAYRWRISRGRFTLVESATDSGQARLTGGAASVRLQDRELAFGAPGESEAGSDWVELRGWVTREARLWYVARYQFFANLPFCRIVLTLTDRHDAELADPDRRAPVRGVLERLLGGGRDGPPSEPWSSGPGDRRWKQRRIAGWRVELLAPGGRPERVTQRNSYDWSRPGEPRVEVASVSGSSYQWRPILELDPQRYQLRHGVGDPRNRVTWYPMHSGRARLEALYTGFKERYKGARGVVYEVRDAHGRIDTVFADQGPGPGVVELGTRDLDAESFVALTATGSGKEPQAIAGSLRVSPEAGRPFEIHLGRRHPGVLSDGPLVLAVKDFWQHHPISMFRTRDALGWQAIERPELLGPGMGLTLESMLSVDGREAEARELLYRPPERTLPAWVHPIDGSLATGAVPRRYDALLREFAKSYPAALEGQDSFGWRNWGDYQIGGSYSDDSGPVEQWANLQYDLPHGLLLAWLRTGDERLWRHAQASVRHLMDVDLVKFQPLPVKLNGLVYRKGETPLARSHVASEPVVDQGFGFRSLLLYHALTGESWARELARQHVRQLAWYGKNRLAFVRFGDRPAAWMLRGALAGAEHFADDPAYDYARIADDLVREILAFHRAAGRLPGGQPVWQGQLVEALALYHARTGRRDVAELITSATRFLLERCLRRKPDGSYELAYSLASREAAAPFGVKRWSGDYNYLFLWLGSLAYADALSGDRRFGERARELFAYASGRLERERSVRHWTSFLGFPHYFLHRFGDGAAEGRPARAAAGRPVR